PANLREQTARNLRQEGYPPEGLVLMPEGATFKSAVDFKAPERRKITEQGYTIILSIGDQDSDLRGGYAERTFKLPNPVYFLPGRACASRRGASAVVTHAGGGENN